MDSHLLHRGAEERCKCTGFFGWLGCLGFFLSDLMPQPYHCLYYITRGFCTALVLAEGPCKEQLKSFQQGSSPTLFYSILC